MKKLCARGLAWLLALCLLMSLGGLAEGLTPEQEALVDAEAFGESSDELAPGEEEIELMTEDMREAASPEEAFAQSPEPAPEEAPEVNRGPSPKEVAGYLNQNLLNAAAELGMTGYNCTAYTAGDYKIDEFGWESGDGKLLMASVRNYLWRVDEITLIEDDTHCVNGVWCGQLASQADSKLKAAGWTLQYGDGAGRSYRKGSSYMDVYFMGYPSGEVYYVSLINSTAYNYHNGWTPELSAAPSKVTLNYKTVTMNAGAFLPLIPTPQDAAYKWKSSKAAVAEVSPTGLVQARREGKVTITVTAPNKKSAKVTVKVVDPNKPVKVAFSEKKVELSLYDTLDLNTLISCEPDTAVPDYTWKSSNKKVAVVSAAGVVTPKREGTVKVTATTWNKKKATVTIKVVDPYKPSSVALEDINGDPLNAFDLCVGEYLTLIPVLTPDTAVATYTWTLSNKKVAEISTTASSATVHAVAPGTTTVTVKTQNGKAFKCKLFVRYDLTNYLCADCVAAAKALGLKANKKKGGYTASGILGAPLGAHTVMDYFHVTSAKANKYSVGGIYVGLVMEAAEEYLYLRGWTAYDSDEDYVSYRNSKNYTVTVNFNSKGKVSGYTLRH